MITLSLTLNALLMMEGLGLLLMSVINYTWRVGRTVGKNIIAGEASSNSRSLWKLAMKHPILSATISSMSLVGYAVWAWMLALSWSRIPRLQSMFFWAIWLVVMLSAVYDLGVSVSMRAAHDAAGKR